MKLLNLFAAKSQENKFTSGGRSMVEMLGVLAIIGVLSVGAIAGYQKAIFKYKLNKLYQQTNTIISALFRYKADLRMVLPENSTRQSLVPILKKLNEIPPEMYIADKPTLVKDVFGTTCEAYHNYGVNVAESIEYRCYLNRSDTGFEVCRSLHQIAKEWHKEIRVINVVAYNANGNLGTTNRAYYGDELCTVRGRCLKDITFDDIYKICQVEKNESRYSVTIYLYEGGDSL